MVSLCAAAMAGAQTVRTMRVDYFHTGSASDEHFALDRVVLEGKWPGPAGRAVDETGFGKYRFEVRDKASNRLLYSRGYATIFNEWQETEEAKTTRRGFEESVRFPAPAAPVRLAIQTRDARQVFHDAWSVEIDPAAQSVDRSPAPAALKPWRVMYNGEPADKVDLLLLGDGYTAAEMDKWHRDAQRLTGTLFAASPFKEHRRDFNVWAIDTPAEASGVSRPSDGVYRRSPLGAAYDALGSERYVLTTDNRRLREIAATAPYEFVEIVVNERKYGGGGIFNFFATVAADNAFTPYVFVHEFGHHFAGLADEYYTSDVAYGSVPARPEPWEPNVTADPQAAKWKELIVPGTALPAPWPKTEFETMQREIQQRRREIRARHRPEQEMEDLFREERGLTTKILGSGPHADRVGAFEGAMYEARGYYRPQADCIMFTRDEVGFCAVCRRAIARVIAMYAR
jgi:hypothetical protein